MYSSPGAAAVILAAKSRLQLIWFAVLSSIPIYLVVGIVAGEVLRVGEAEASEIRRLLLAAGLSALAAGVFWPRLTLGDNRLRACGSIDAASVRIFSHGIASFALIEAAGMIGLVSFFFTHLRQDLYLAMAITTVALLRQRSDLMQILDRAGVLFPEA